MSVEIVITFQNGNRIKQTYLTTIHFLMDNYFLEKISHQTEVGKN